MPFFTGYIGTYATPRSRGIYRFTVDSDTGELTHPVLDYLTPDSKYLSLWRNLLAAPVTDRGRAGICLLDAGHPGSPAMAESFDEETSACFVVQDESHVYSANYHEGTVLVYEKGEHTLKLIKRILIQPKAGCHQVLLHRHYLLVPCLLMDEVRIFDMDQDFAPAGAISFPKGSGPRHGIFDREHRRLIFVSELSNQLFVFRAGEDGDFKLCQTCGILPEGEAYPEPPASAAVRLSQDERYLYVSTRFANRVSVFCLDGESAVLTQQIESGGDHPRDIALTPDDNYLLAIHRFDGGLVCFRRDKESGTLTRLDGGVPAPQGVSVVFAQP